MPNLNNDNLPSGDDAKWRNPSEDYPPTRPGLKWTAYAFVIVLSVVSIMHSAAIASFIHHEFGI
jgi:hypothetical protein